ncbi:EAL domain-containing protein [Beduinella massiliensis]|uniref:EAL domain-containing protein n=1 Tax=Beduinella massiliensis TaxID=1852363 RepID=UPI0031F91666
MTMDRERILKLIEEDALELYGQPKWTFGKNTCNTYEVFAEKIRQPNGESVPARELIDAVEADEELTRLFYAWFMERAMQTAVRLTAETDSNVTLSINVLAAQANEPGFFDQVLATMEKTKMRPYKLQFELSEAQGLTRVGIENINRLHDEQGISMLLGNFGTGHSNIDLLREVHFDGLELDRSFASGVPDDEQTCKLLVAVAHFADTLDLFVCAKGIETDDQMEFFEQLNFLKGQGYMIGPPMPMDELRDYIKMYAKKRSHE